MKKPTKCSKKLNVHEKINIRSRYSELVNRAKKPYTITFGFLDIWTWNTKPYFKN
jgi:hypothetical protein